MGIGPDIAEVRNELGTSFTIVRLGVVEKIDCEVSTTTKDPITQEYYFDATFSYNTLIVVGDIIQSGGETFIVLSKASDEFEDEIVEYAAILFKCNLPNTTNIITPTSSTNTTTFVVTQGWTVRLATVYGLIYTKSRYAVAEQTANTGREVVYVLTCIVPASYGTEINDRVMLTSTEYYRVQNVDKYKYSGAHCLTLVEDERLVYAP